RGSLGLDLATTVNVTLIDRSVVKVATGVCGPPAANGQEVGALLIERSSAALKGLTIVPRLIDADYTGEIMVMLKTDFPPIFIPKRSKIAQLVPLAQLTEGLSPSAREERGELGFGSADTIAMLSLTMGKRPSVSAAFTYQGGTVLMTALMDRGADITIVS
ncbi:POK9 protein, partial [Ifrita kowaldi]|nr:POK9 protein [Ifrita kowaldi]